MKHLLLTLLVCFITLFNVAHADDNVECLAIAMLKEAANQPVVGRQAVGLVILNRAEQRNKTVCAVIKEKGQFSWYKGGRLAKYVKKDSRIHGIRFEAHDLIDNPQDSKAYRRVALRSATYFHATYVSPSWRKSMCKPTRIRDHIFYSECTA